MTGRKKSFLLLVLFLLLFVLLLPSLLKSVLELALSRAVSDSKVPLVSGRVKTLGYHGLIMSDWMADAGNGVLIQMPRLEAVYSPGTLLRGRIPSVDGKIVSESNVVFEADFSVREFRPFSGAEFSLWVESLEIPENSLSLSNLATACTVCFSGGKIRSLPKQLLTIDQISAGDLQMDQIQMRYQLEPGPVLFVEDLELNWCGGRVSLYNARIDPEMTSMSVQLFCDRLSLEQVLASFGLKDFYAGGELNGRLPLEWTADGLRIDRGFLFTTPGRGGTFSFGAAEVAAAVLPPGSLEKGQVGLVAAALAEFNYDWITMTLNSEGESLRLAIELSGTPEHVLPYEYDSQTGTYVKISLRPGHGIRQPMRFQLNLTIPLDQLLCYASGVNRQWNLFKTK